MRYATRLSDAVHALVLICLYEGEPASSRALAESIRTNPSYVRTLLAKMKAHGLVASTRGAAGATLGRPAEDITLLDVYRAIEGDCSLLHLDTHVNAQCSHGVFIQLAIQEYYNEVQAVAERAMERITLAAIVAASQARVDCALQEAAGIEEAVAQAIAALQGPEPDASESGMRRGRPHVVE